MTLALVLGFVSPAAGQAAFVKSGTGQEGQGFVFRDGSTCWLVTAAHLFRDPVRGEQRNFQILMEGQPPTTGQGSVEMPFWDGLDLAIGAVRITSGPSCRVDFAALMASSPNLSGIDLLRIPEVSAAGQLQWSDARLSEFLSHAEFHVSLERAYKGRSGAVVFKEGVPVGMITKQQDDTTHGVLHVEEMTMNLQRWLTFDGGSFAPPAQVVEAEQEAGFDVVVESTTLIPAEVSQQIDSVLLDGVPFLYQGNGEIVLRVADDTVQRLSRVVIESDGSEAVPKNVTVAVDTSDDGQGFPRYVWGGGVDPAGRYDSGQRAAQRMRRVVLTFWDSWDVGPRRIDRIRLY